MTQTITRDELKSSIDAGEVTLVETLRAEHFEQGHLPGAIHVHFEEVADKAPALLPDKDAAIVTYCSNTACRNSEAAANQLAAMASASTPRERTTGPVPACPSRPGAKAPLSRRATRVAGGRCARHALPHHQAVARARPLPARQPQVGLPPSRVARARSARLGPEDSRACSARARGNRSRCTRSILP